MAVEPIVYSASQLIELRKGAVALGFWDDVEHYNEQLRRLGVED